MSVRPSKTLISLGIRPVWSESSPNAQWIAKDARFLHVDREDSDQTGRMSLRWVHMPFCWFCHEAAHLCLTSHNLDHDKQCRNRSESGVWKSSAPHVSVISRSPSHTFWMVKTYKKCNPPDFKIYLTKLTNQFCPYGVTLILGLFSLLFCIVYCRQTNSELTLHHMR